METPLTKGQKYYISLKVSCADRQYVSCFATNKIGVKFFTLKPDTIHTTNNSHFFTTNIISDTANWVRLSGSFTADSVYKYIAIGNFFDDTNTTITSLNNNCNNGGAYYYIDDVCVSKDSALCYTGISNLEESIKIYPSPANNFIIIKGLGGINITIYNSIGQRIKYIYSTPNARDLFIDCSSWASGLYFFKTNTHTYKLIIKH